MLIHLRHARQLTYCIPGIKLFFKTYNLDFRDFMRNGIEEEKLIATGDGFADRVIAVAKQEVEQNGK